MLIAIMSDTYAKVQENSIAANNRALAGMLLEQEEIYNLMKSITKGDLSD